MSEAGAGRRVYLCAVLPRNFESARHSFVDLRFSFNLFQMIDVGFRFAIASRENLLVPLFAFGKINEKRTELTADRRQSWILRSTHQTR